MIEALLDPTFAMQILVDGLARGAMYGLMGIGLALVFGILGIINLGHGEFFMLGCYAMYWLLVILGLPAWLSIPLAAGILLIVGVLIELGLLAPLRWRFRDRWLTDGYVLTIGIMIILQNLALIIFGAQEHGIASLWPGRIFIGDVVIAKDRILVLVGAAVAVGGLAVFLRYTFLGRAIRATGEHPEAAQVVGIDIRLIYRITFGISAALAGATGALLLSTYPAYPLVGGDIMLKSFVVVIIGGLGNIWGALLAGLLLGTMEAFATVLSSGGWQNSLSALLVLLVLVVRPSGLFSRQTSRP
jgi:branched-chain amino acid transport system permease protein